MCVIDKSGNRIEIIFEAVIPKLNQRNSNHVNPNCYNARFPSIIYKFWSKGRISSRTAICIYQWICYDFSSLYDSTKRKIVSIVLYVEIIDARLLVNIYK